MNRRPLPCFLVVAAVVLAPRVALAQDLAPPPPIDPNTPSAPSAAPTSGLTPGAEQQNQTLTQEEGQDSGRGNEIFYVNGEAGGSYINMKQFSESQLAIVNSAAGGPMFGLGAGIRLLVFTLGVRARLHQLSNFNLWQLDGEFGFHIPIKMWDPYINLHGGYDFVGTLDSSALDPSTSGSSGNVSVHGFNAGLSLGADYYVTPLVSIGLDLTGDALFLQRPPVPLPQNIGVLPSAQQTQIRNDPLYANSGDSVGFGLSGSLHLGVHL